MTAKPYETVRYPGMPFSQSHPDRLAAMGTLFGMNPPSVLTARVLEIGCCDGGNIIPMALRFPAARFVGIDLTEIDILAARETAAALNLTNIEFHALDLTTLPGPLGQFDYIVAHGLYAWLPDEVREKMLSVVKETLTPDGIAYVSYNTLPGCHLRLIMRDLMMFHSAGVTDPREIIERSKHILRVVASTSTIDPVYHEFFVNETKIAMSRNEFGIFHDDLSDHNNPCYFHQFAAHAARYGLQFLAEANFSDMVAPSRELADHPILEEVYGDRVLREQYYDFARNRRFRQTLLCHRHIAVDNDFQKQRVKSLYFAAPVTFVSSEDGKESFEGPNNQQFTINNPAVLSFLHALIDAWPAAVHFDDLPGAQSDPEGLCSIIQAFMGSDLIEVRASALNVSKSPGEMPVVSALARMQAANGRPVTTLRHGVFFAKGETERRLVYLLDGTRDRAALLADLMPHLDPEKTLAQHRDDLETSLNSLARLGLFST